MYYKIYDSIIRCRITCCLIRYLRFYPSCHHVSHHKDAAWHDRLLLRRVPAGPKPPRCLLPRRRSYDDAIVWEINLGLRRQRQLLPPSAPLPASRARLSTFLTPLHVMGGKGWDPRLPSSTLNPPFTALVVEPTWYTLRGLFFFCVA